MGHESPVPELPITDCAVAQHQGYGESKHISEQFGTLQQRNSVFVLVSCVSTLKALGMIPATLPDVNWIPVDIIADIVVDIIHSPDAESPATFNLVNPKPVPWASLVPTVQSWFGTEKVTVAPLHEWITALRSVDMGDANAVKAAPATKIGDFFEAIARSNAHSPKYTTIMGPAISKTMAEVGPVNPGWMYIWLSQWNF
ncbi:hypothetical protein LTR99_010733 [Exophiala xenobiotica]|uniref:Thioester reductase (TE) domain-containing protein n=1 Tax=Vermiconidia calcicola TaxID=1690605 RepID=A0AAV9PQZ4_9PEZI|nr:hypothetical protein LTR96_005556 [Exophiala xenobiotica]KAK5527760.1 hypothetical protein LTR25_010891 [Vermiconidia calcicola]KAK5291606.1 hypothetical protein LTR99_010733 [Exophiala xenobiotica]KAK5333048.1 hypothetical protein LTR98_010868 [Exophiala xenobiotica]KAK5367668.1 hypothetical protein LTS13_007598 [Exophiala xenobiotica]